MALYGALRDINIKNTALQGVYLNFFRYLCTQ